MKLYSTYRDITRNATTVPVKLDTNGPYVDTYRLRLRNIPSGSRVLLTGQGAFTNDCGFNVGVGMWIAGRALGNEDGSVVLNDAQLLPANMENITPNSHHGIRPFAVWDVNPYPDMLYCFVTYAAASAAQSNSVIGVDDNGLIEAALFVPDGFDPSVSPAPYAWV